MPGSTISIFVSSQEYMLEKPLEARQLVGILLLVPLTILLIFQPRLLWEDMDGMLGLVFVAGVGCLVPRPWMPVALRWIAVYFAVMALYWIPWDGRVNLKTLPIVFAFAISAVAMWLAANVASRRPKVEEQPEID